MRNLRYFCHYHCGGPKEQSIKIAGSLLIAVALLTWSFAARADRAIEEEASLLGQLLPEPVYLIAAAEDAPQLEQAAPAETPSVSPTSSSEVKEEMNGDNDERERFEQERQAAELKRWKSDRLKEAKNLLKEVDKVRKLIMRLKGTADEIAKLDAIKKGVNDFVSQVKATTDNDDLRFLLEETDFGEWWETKDRLQAAVEIPRDLNNIRRDQKRVQSILKQKWVCKIVDCDKFLPVIQNMNTQLDEATRLYQAGELEDARAAVQETFHDKGWFGDAMGAVQMMRGFTDPMRSIRDQTLKGELTALLEPVKETLYEGEVREARETMEIIQRELGPVVWKAIENAQNRKKDIPESVWKKIEKLQQRFEQEENPAVPAETVPAP